MGVSSSLDVSADFLVKWRKVFHCKDSSDKSKMNVLQMYICTADLRITERYQAGQFKSIIKRMKVFKDFNEKF